MTRKPKRGSPIRPAKAIEVAYRKRLLRIIAEINAAFKDVVAPALKPNSTIGDAALSDGIGEELARRFALLRQMIDLFKENTAEQLAEEVVAQADRDNARRVNRATSITRVELPSTLGEVVAREGTGDALAAMASENAALITKMSNDYIDRIQAAVTSNYLRGEFIGKGGLQKELTKIKGITTRRAKLIARDQTSKMSGALTKIRSQAAGSEYYQWRNMKDARVRGNPSGLYPKARPSHWTREGKYYFWEPTNKVVIAPDGSRVLQPPSDGNPSQPINCRCIAVPIFT